MIYILSSFYTNESCMVIFFFFSSRRRHTRFDCDWSSDVCSSDLISCQRHRRRLLVWLWFPSLSWRPDVLGRERDRLEDGAGEVAEVRRTERWQMARGFAAAREIGGRGEGLRERRSGLRKSSQRAALEQEAAGVFFIFHDPQLNIYQICGCIFALKQST